MSNFPIYDSSQAKRLAPAPAGPGRSRRLLAYLCLVAAIALSVTAAALVLMAPPANPASAPTPVRESPTRADSTAAPASVPTKPIRLAQAPTLSPAEIAELLAQPLPQLADTPLSIRLDPFTILPNRARSQFTSAIAQRGDTIDGIANRYGLQRESIAWCNSHELAQIVRPGDVVTIPPQDGACHTVLRAQAKDIRDIAAQYGVDDPYIIIDAPANAIAGMTPETLLPSNTFLFIPGGEGAVITWNAPVEQDGAGNVVAFDPGSPYSCGSRFGGGSYWTNPLPNGTWVRGFYAGHSGIDIAAPIGTPIYAANAGPILYAGWNSWGYGSTVVIGHGPFSTLYGHMSSIAVSCGQTVAAGQVIGTVGSSGNSSGPHLHFEIRYLNQPHNPSATAGIGW